MTSQKYFGDGFDKLKGAKAKYDLLAGEFGAPYDTFNFPTAGELIYAYLTYEDYSSDCHLVWVCNGQMYEWRGGCCSCNGYSEYASDFADWGPLRTIPTAILMRPHLDPDLKDAVKCFLPD